MAFPALWRHLDKNVKVLINHFLPNAFKNYTLKNIGGGGMYSVDTY